MVELVFFVGASLIGFTAAIAAVILWLREGSSAWLSSRRGQGALCLLIGGGIGIAVVQYRTIHDFVDPLRDEFVQAMQIKTGLFFLACLALMAFGAWQIARNPPKDAPSARGVLVPSLAAAIIIVSLETNVLQFLRLTGDENYVAPLAGRAVAYETVPINSIYKNSYQFRPETGHYFSHNIPIWEKLLAGYKGKPDVQYLEVGLFEGQSACWMLENVLTDPTARLTGIDPFLDIYDPHYPEPYKNVLFSNLKLAGAEEKCRIIEGFSQTELRKLPLKSFDIIYIDGSHMRADVLEDAVLSWRLLKDGGILIFDDYRMPGTTREEKPKSAIDTFHAFFGNHFEVLHVGYQAVLKKTAEEK
jgi:predicted O-methyltransferase YrrM